MGRIDETLTAEEKGAKTMDAPHYANLRREFGIDDEHGDPLAIKDDDDSVCEKMVWALEQLFQEAKKL